MSGAVCGPALSGSSSQWSADDVRCFVESDGALVPDGLGCPIGYDLMTDPVRTTHGGPYQRRHIERWLVLHPTDPLTNLRLPDRTLKVDHVARDALAAFRVYVLQNHPGREALFDVADSHLGAPASSEGEPASPHPPLTALDLDRATWLDMIAYTGELKLESERFEAAGELRRAVAKLRECSDIWNWVAESPRFSLNSALLGTAEGLADEYRCRADRLDRLLEPRAARLGTLGELHVPSFGDGRQNIGGGGGPTMSVSSLHRVQCETAQIGCAGNIQPVMTCGAKSCDDRSILRQARPFSSLRCPRAQYARFRRNDGSGELFRRQQLAITGYAAGGCLRRKWHCVAYARQPKRWDCWCGRHLARRWCGRRLARRSGTHGDNDIIA